MEQKQQTQQRRGAIMQDTEIYTVAELAEKWRVSVQTVQRWIRENKIEAFKVGRSWRIPKEQDFRTIVWTKEMK